MNVVICPRVLLLNFFTFSASTIVFGSACFYNLASLRTFVSSLIVVVAFGVAWPLGTTDWSLMNTSSLGITYSPMQDLSADRSLLVLGFLLIGTTYSIGV